MKRLVIVGWVVLSTVALRAQAPAGEAPPPAQEPAAPVVPINAGFANPDGAWEKLRQDYAALQATTMEDIRKSPGKIRSVDVEAYDFATLYPHDPNAFNATMLWVQLADVMSQQKLPGGPTDEEINRQLDKMGSDLTVPKSKRAQLRATQLVRSLQVLAQPPEGTAAQWDAIDALFDGFQKDFGEDYAFEGKPPLLIVLRTQELKLLSVQPDKARYQALLQKLAKDPLPQIAAEAQAEMAQQK
jgi:hypothetical protein